MKNSVSGQRVTLVIFALIALSAVATITVFFFGFLAPNYRELQLKDTERQAIRIGQHFIRILENHPFFEVVSLR